MLYKIVNADTMETMALVDEPRYIRLSRTSSSFIPASERQAQGVVVDGAVYNLLGHQIGEGLDTVMALRVDGGEYILRTKESVADVENAMCEQDTDTDARLSDIELALCELDERTA